MDGKPQSGARKDFECSGCDVNLVFAVTLVDQSPPKLGGAVCSETRSDLMISAKRSLFHYRFPRLT